MTRATMTGVATSTSKLHQDKLHCQGPRNGFYLGEAPNLLFSPKFHTAKIPSLDWLNLGEARASVPHRFRGA